MTRAAWITDVHLNFLAEEPLRQFFCRLREEAIDTLLVGGDTAEGPSISRMLLHLAAGAGCAVYFVLGNHDYYRSSIARTRAQISLLAEQTPALTYLTAGGVISLAPGTALVGHDGWADARLGDFQRSDVLLNDYLLIEELRTWIDLFTLDRDELERRLRCLGDEVAAHFHRVVPEALATHRRVVVLTHVPPFRESCCHAGKISDDNWLPHFSCAAAGKVLCELMAARPDREMLVLCGHTHCEADVQILPNLRVLTGGADYGHPIVQRVFEFDETGMLTHGMGGKENQPY
jgi:predicted MPP superfamily phosphohydrolase